MKPRALGAGLAVLVTAAHAGGCGRDSGGDGAIGPARVAVAETGTNAVTAPPELGLRPVPLPDVPGTANTVRDQIATRRDHVTTALAQPTAKPALGQAYGELGQILQAATAFDGAEAAYLNAHQLVPRDPRWPYYLGHLYRARGPLDKAVEWFERARERQPDDLAILVWLGDVQLALGRPELAEPLFSRAVSLSETSAAAHFGVGRTALARRDYTAAVRHLERALALDPRATGIHYSLAMAYRGSGDLARAEQELTIKGDLEPRPADPLMQSLDSLLESAEAYNVRGGAELNAGNWKAAAEQFRKGLEIRPTDPSLRHRLGTALAQMGDGPGAIAAFEQVIRTTPGYARAYFSIGVIAAESGRLDVAIQQFQTALAHEPGYVQARVQLGWALARSGRPGESLAHFEQALALEPTQADATFGYGMALVRLQRYTDARERLNAAAQLHPDNPLIAHALARILSAAPDAKARDGRQAKAIVDRLLAKQGQSLELGETAAMMLAELGEFQQAVLLQGDLIAGAERMNVPQVVNRLKGNLARYERGEACRLPFTDAEL